MPLGCGELISVSLSCTKFKPELVRCDHNLVRSLNATADVICHMNRTEPLSSFVAELVTTYPQGIMTMKYVEIVALAGSSDTIAAIAEKVKAVDFRLGIVGEDGMQQMRMLIDEDNLQSALDAMQNLLGAQTTVRIVVLPIEASLPKPIEEKDKKKNLRRLRENYFMKRW